MCVCECGVDMCACVCTYVYVCACVSTCVSYAESSQSISGPSLQSHINLGLSPGRCPQALSPLAWLCVSQIQLGLLAQPPAGSVLMVMAVTVGVTGALCRGSGVLWGDVPRRTGLGGAVG